MGRWRRARAEPWRRPGRQDPGFDCSGLTQYAWASAGVLIGRTTRQQWRHGTRVPREQLRPGDLVFYDSDPRQRGPEHVGLVVDGEHMVNAPFTGASVRVEPLDRPTFKGVVDLDRDAARVTRS